MVSLICCATFLIFQIIAVPDFCVSHSIVPLFRRFSGFTICLINMPINFLFIPFFWNHCHVLVLSFFNAVKWNAFHCHFEKINIKAYKTYNLNFKISKHLSVYTLGLYLLGKRLVYEIANLTSESWKQDFLVIRKSRPSTKIDITIENEGIRPKVALQNLFSVSPQQIFRIYCEPFKAEFYQK